MAVAREHEIRSMVIQPGVRWGAVIAGTIVAIGVWLLLHTLALGIGLTAVDPMHPDSLRGVGIGTGIATLLVPLIALFVGGLVAGRVAGALTVTGATILGAILWALTILVAAVLMVFALSAMTGIRTAPRPGPTAVVIPAEEVSVTSRQLLGPVNTRLTEQGREPVNTETLDRAFADAAARSPGGEVDRAILIEAVAANTALTAADVSDLLATVEQRLERRMQLRQELAERRAQRALEQVEHVGRAMLTMFFMLAACLATAIAGTLLAARRNLRTAERTFAPAAPPPAAAPPTAPA